MTIVVASDHASINGGLAKVAIESAIGLASRGHRVFYFAAVAPVEARLYEAGVDVICLDQPDLLNDDSALRAATRGIWNRAAAERLSALLNTLDPSQTILHVHGWAKALSPSIGRVIARTPVPTVHTIHEYFLACPNGAFFNYRQQSNCPLTPLSAACVSTNCDVRAYRHKAFRVVRQAALWWLGGMPSGIRHFICISDLQRQVIQPYLPPQANIYSVANPISVEDRGPANPEHNDTYLFVGRLSAEKGAILFAEAARQTGLKAVFVGAGGEADHIRGIFPSAELHGWLPPDQVLATMRGARALVFPSLWYECQPLTTFESLANGIPVIVSDNCAGREAVRDGETGLWFPSRDVNALADVMQRLTDADTAKAMGRKAYDTYWENPLTLDRHIDGLEATYAIVRRDPRGSGRRDTR
ncbi:MAG: glycosyltransferase family 4 protein [Rhodospirillales bacterium]|nr:glycosyltransferase family 4 protein [Rhodospirillales bacterium]